MKKRIMALFLALTVVASATGCGKGYKIGDKGEVYNDYITVKKWKGLEVEKVEPIAVKDEDVQGAIDSDIQTLTSYEEVKDRGAKNGDQVSIDYVGKLDGVAFQGGTGSDNFILGEGSFVPGFQEGIVGHKAGEKFDVPLTFPEKSNKEAAEEQMRSNLFGLLSKEWDVKEYPKEDLKKHKKEAKEYYEQEYQGYLSYVASMSGTSVEEVKSTYGMTVDEFVSTMYGTTIEEMAKMQHALQMTMDLIAKVEKIKVEKKDMDAFLKKQADVAGYELDEYKEMLEKESDDEDELEEMIRKATFQEKILDFLWENCKIVEPKKTETQTQTGTGTENETDKESSETVTE